MLGAMLCACTGSSSSTVAAPTLITAHPEVFTGDVRCRTGQLTAYVVSLQDTLSDAAPFTLVSLPTSCTTSVSFASPPLIIGHEYTATIEGYDIPLDQISIAVNDNVYPSTGRGYGITGTDLAAATAGARELIQSGTGTTVIPRWATTCGRLPSGTDGGAHALLTPTPVIQYLDSELLGCIPFSSSTNNPGDGGEDGGSGSSDARGDAESPESGLDAGLASDAQPAHGDGPDDAPVVEADAQIGPDVGLEATNGADAADAAELDRAASDGSVAEDSLADATSDGQFLDGGMSFTEEASAAEAGP